jgi:hypothetical protein
MATKSIAVGGTAGVSATQARNADLYRVHRVLDFSQIKIDGSAITTADVLELLNVPAYDRVMSVYVETLTAAGVASTMNVGDDGSATRFANAHDLNVVGTITSYVTGYTYTAANTIDLAFGTNGPTAAKVLVELVMLPLRSEVGSTPSNG